MLDESLSNGLIELIASNFKSDQINEIGRLLYKEYNSHKLAGKSDHITLSSRTTAGLLVEWSKDNKRVPELIKLVIELDEQSLLGVRITITGTENFLSELGKAGYIYDFEKRKVVQTKTEINEMPNWGSLKDGKTYSITVLSIDIVENSELVKKYGTKMMEKVYYLFWDFLRSILVRYNGRIWSWAGDGGILAFAFKDHINGGVECTLEIMRLLPIFNIKISSMIKDIISIRCALDSGKIKFFYDTGKIISDTINLAAHLEKKNTHAGYVSITDTIKKELKSKTAAIFDNLGKFEGTTVHTTYKRLDDMFR